jgi:hypothetical protein
LNFGELGWVIILILAAYDLGRLHEKIVGPGRDEESEEFEDTEEAANKEAMYGLSCSMR